MIAFLALEPEHADAGTGASATGPVAAPPAGSDLADARSGLRVRGGSLVALVGDRPDETAAVAERLGLTTPTRDEAVTLGGVPLAALPLADVRRRVVVSDTGAALFSGRLRDVLDVSGRTGTDDLVAALATASAADVVAGLPGGLDSVVTERGRSFSGGQRQRLVLARVLALDPEVLVLVEPTSAVDAHTEAAVAGRLRDHRRGRTTVVTTSSPLLLDAVDEVAYLRGGRVVAQGRHRDLLASVPDYRLTVTREDLEEVGPR